MNKLKLKLIAVLAVVSSIFSSIAVAQDTKFFYTDTVGGWSIIGHPGTKKLPPACILQLEDEADTFSFQYVFGLFDADIQTMFAIINKKANFIPSDKWQDGYIVFENGTAKTKVLVQFKAISQTQLNVSINPKQGKAVLKAFLNSTNVTFIRMSRTELELTIKDDVVAASESLVKCMEVHEKKGAI